MKIYLIEFVEKGPSVLKFDHGVVEKLFSESVLLEKVAIL